MKFSVILGNLGNTCDRFLSSGYKDPEDKETIFHKAVYAFLPPLGDP